MSVRTTVLDNGMTVLTDDMPHLESASIGIWVKAGSRSETLQEHGISHVLEHMAFKGTETIGSTNWPAEKAAIENIERVYDQLDAEKAKLQKADPQKIKTLEEQVQGAIEKAASYVEPNLYPRIIEENGGVGMKFWNWNAGDG